MTNLAPPSLLRALVMDAIANDYEPLSMISEEVSLWAAEQGYSAPEEIVRETLRLLVLEGFAKEYRVDASHNLIDASSSADLTSIYEPYFLLTPEGTSAIVY